MLSKFPALWTPEQFWVLYQGQGGRLGAGDGRGKGWKELCSAILALCPIIWALKSCACTYHLSNTLMKSVSSASALILTLKAQTQAGC